MFSIPVGFCLRESLGGLNLFEPGFFGAAFSLARGAIERRSVDLLLGGRFLFRLLRDIDLLLEGNGLVLPGGFRSAE